MRTYRTPCRARHQAGMTLIELLVAMTVGLVVTLVALSMLILGRTGYNTVDSTTQLLDRERFAVDAISRVLLQAGYQNFGADVLTSRFVAAKTGNDPEPDLFGWNNAAHVLLDDLLISETTKILDENRPGTCTVNDTSCKNGSDILVVRFQGSGPTSSPDQTMVNCMGNPEPGPGGFITDRSANVFYVARNATTGEPSLFCSYYNFTSSTPKWVAGQPLIEGVESMQLLFGTDNVTPGTAPAVVSPALEFCDLPGALPPLGRAQVETNCQDLNTDRWLRADQLKVPGDPVATRKNWRRVRDVRVGLVLRGPVGSAQERVTDSFAPLGSPTYVSTADTGSQLDVAADGRLRRVVNFTVHIRNDLSTR